MNRDIALTLGVAFITGLFTLLGSHLASKSSMRQLALRLRHERERDLIEAHRERLEELYSLVSAWSKVENVHYMTLVPAMKGEAPLKIALAGATKGPTACDLDRLFALAELYFRCS